MDGFLAWREKFGLSGNVLKWIGIITMFIDHVGAVLIFKICTWDSVYRPKWVDIYWVFRRIGRLAFPLFAFLIVEGFIHTRNWKKYCGRLALFALLSEIPFNLAFGGQWFTTEKTSVLATFTFGVLLLGIWRALTEPAQETEPAQGTELTQETTWAQGTEGPWYKRAFRKILAFLILLWHNRIFRQILAFLVLLGLLLLADWLNMDYGSVGVAVVFVFYQLRNHRLLASVLCCGALLFVSQTEIWALFSIIPILLYNGKRGRQMKYFFYIFYPAHILLLGIIGKYYIFPVAEWALSHIM